MKDLSEGAAASDVRRLSNLLFQIRGCPKPVIAKINGAASGAGVALAVACDMAVAHDEAQFSLPAVRLGNIPAVIAPFVIEAMGMHQARRYLLTGETFTALEARRLGVVHAVAAPPQLHATVDAMIDELLKGGPSAIAETKMLITRFGDLPPSERLLDAAAKESARVRRTDEAREGLAAFIEKRPPNWRRTEDT